jgi:hypothetical protein
MDEPKKRKLPQTITEAGGFDAYFRAHGHDPDRIVQRMYPHLADTKGAEGSKPTEIKPTVAGAYAVVFVDMALSVHMSEPSAKRYQAEFDENLQTYAEREHMNLVMVWGWILKHNGRMAPKEIYLMDPGWGLHRFETVAEAAAWVREKLGNTPPAHRELPIDVAPQAKEPT